MNTIIDLKKTNLTHLEETTFRPILNTLVPGTGQIQLHGNHQGDKFILVQVKTHCFFL